jgi:hypothetical protein
MNEEACSWFLVESSEMGRWGKRRVRSPVPYPKTMKYKFELDMSFFFLCLKKTIHAAVPCFIDN